MKTFTLTSITLRLAVVLAVAAVGLTVAHGTTQAAVPKTESHALGGHGPVLRYGKLLKTPGGDTVRVQPLRGGKVLVTGSHGVTMVVDGKAVTARSWLGKAWDWLKDKLPTGGGQTCRTQTIEITQKDGTKIKITQDDCKKPH